MAGRHATRFIIEVRINKYDKWKRSINALLATHFPTRKKAQEALDIPGSKSSNLEYRIRQK